MTLRLFALTLWGAVFALLAVLALFLPQLADGWRAGKPPLPDFALASPAPDLVPPLAAEDLRQGQIAVVNFWASWCAPCRAEHKFLLQLAADADLLTTGIAFKDAQADAARFLHEFGNPFALAGLDENGAAGLAFGLYGVPETFIISHDGAIVYRHFGPLSEESFTASRLPALAQARSAAQRAKPRPARQ